MNYQFALPRGGLSTERHSIRRWASTLGHLAGLTLAWAMLMAVALHLRRWPDSLITWIPWAILALLTGVVLGGWLVVGLWAWRTFQEWRWVRLEAKSLAEMQALSPSDFEAYVGQVFARLGYRVRNTPDQKDHGIDLEVVSPDGTRGVIQCKRYRGTVGEPELRDFYGAMLRVGVGRGFFVTTSRFSRPARRWAQGTPIELIDGPRLVRMAYSAPARMRSSEEMRERKEEAR